jgi:hypothetical protein
MVGLLTVLVGTQLRGVPTKEAARVPTIDQNRAGYGVVVDDPMDDVRTGNALGDTRDGIVGKVAAQGLEHIDFTLFTKLVRGVLL